MPRRMARLKKSRNTPRQHLALNPLKSKDVLAVLAERNQAVVPVGAWVEPASPDSSEFPAYTSACVIEEELKEQLRKKQEALKDFQSQVKHRVNQHVRLRKKQQLQRSYEAAVKEGSVAMRSLHPAHLTPKRRTNVFPNNLNAAIGSSWSLPSPEDGKDQDELFKQQAQVLSQTMKEVRHRLASVKTVGEKKASVFPDDKRKSVPTQEKVQFKNPLFDVIEGEELKKLHLQDVLPKAQDYLPEVHNDLSETQTDLSGIQSVEPEVQNIETDTQALEPEVQAGELETHAGEPEAQTVETEIQGVVLEARSTKPEDESVMLEVQDFLPLNEVFLPKDQNFLSKDPDFLLKGQDVVPKDQSIFPEDQNILTKCQEQDFLPKDQKADLKQPASILIGRREREVFPLDVHQNLLHRHQDQASIRYKKVRFKEPYSDMTDERRREDLVLADCQYLPPKLQDQPCIRDQNLFLKQPSPLLREEKVPQELPQESHHCFMRKIQDQASVREQHSNYGQDSCDTEDKRLRKELFPEHHQYVLHEIQDPGYTRKQVYDAYHSGLNTEFQAPLALRSGVDQEEEKKVRQKQYLRYKRLFMDIEREQVKEQQRQKEHKKKIDKIKKKKEQERYAEEQRILRMICREEPCSGDNMSDILAQLQLEEIKGEREKQKQREKEYLRYIEALRVQIQEKIQRYNITLPPLCCCGPEFWDAHPDTCANNCIFYKNHRAYARALHSMISSCDIPERNSGLRTAIRNFASLQRWTKNLKSTSS